MYPKTVCHDTCMYCSITVWYLSYERRIIFCNGYRAAKDDTMYAFLTIGYYYVGHWAMYCQEVP